MKPDLTLEEQIAKSMALAVDGSLNDWEDFKPEALNVSKSIRSLVKDLLLTTSDDRLRTRLNRVFGLSVYAPLFTHDLQPKVCSEQRQSLPFRRRTVRRRSSAC